MSITKYTPESLQIAIEQRTPFGSLIPLGVARKHPNGRFADAFVEWLCLLCNTETTLRYQQVASDKPSRSTMCASCAHRRQRRRSPKPVTLDTAPAKCDVDAATAYNALPKEKQALIVAGMAGRKNAEGEPLSQAEWLAMFRELVNGAMTHPEAIKPLPGYRRADHEDVHGASMSSLGMAGWGVGQAPDERGEMRQ